MNWKILLLRSSAALVALWALWWCLGTFLASETTQMQRVQAAFIEDLADRDWEAVDPVFTDDYNDMWGQDAAKARHTARKLLEHFILLGIQSEVTHAQAASGIGFVKTKLTVQGTGGGASPYIVAESKRIKEPWVFHWKKTGSWPWNWQIVGVANPALEGFKPPREMEW
jgi:hypothetical protein